MEEETHVALLQNQKSKKMKGVGVRLVFPGVVEKTYSKYFIFCRCLHCTEQRVMVTWGNECFIYKKILPLMNKRGRRKFSLEGPLYIGFHMLNSNSTLILQETTWTCIHLVYELWAIEI